MRTPAGKFPRAQTPGYDHLIILGRSPEGKGPNHLRRSDKKNASGLGNANKTA
jgi:hypothetical protein